MIIFLHALQYVTLIYYNSPDAEVDEVKCVNKVMDEIIPDGIGSSDSDDGKLYIRLIY